LSEPAGYIGDLCDELQVVSKVAWMIASVLLRARFHLACRREAGSPIARMESPRAIDERSESQPRSIDTSGACNVDGDHSTAHPRALAAAAAT
jgi:hypothetical protein